MILRTPTFYIFVQFFLLVQVSLAQEIDHWETIVYAEDSWSYTLGSQDIPEDWNRLDAVDLSWLEGEGGFGYGDNDDGTVIPQTLSVYMRKEFNIPDKSKINSLILSADYDDAFVAYLNGQEIARSNIGTIGIEPPYDLAAANLHEADLYQGQSPEDYVVFPFIVASLLQEGENVLAIQVHNEDITSSDLTSNFYLSASLIDESSFFGPTPDWFSYSEESDLTTHLPIFQINTFTNQIQDEPRIIADLKVTHDSINLVNSLDDMPNVYDGRISIEFRGTSSLLFEKKNYSFETQLSDGSNNNVSILGLPAENDWVLHGPYSDKSLMRNVLSYHIGSLTGKYAPRTRYVELVINEKYEGVYVLMESIKQDKNRVDIAKLTPTDNEGDEVTGGYIIKVDRNEMNIPGIGWYSEFPDNRFFAYVDPKPDAITSSQADYIQDFMFDFESGMWGPNYLETIEETVYLDSWVDYFLVNEITKHIDMYKLSFYMYKDKESNGGKLHFGPIWDFNLGFGNFNFTCDPNPTGWGYEFYDCGPWHPFWPRKILEVPNVRHRINCRWNELRADLWSTDSLIQYIEDQRVYLGDAVERNYDRWEVMGTELWPNYFVGETYDDEINYLKSWLTQRLEWMDDEMLGDCNDYISSTDNPTINEFRLTVYPNPVSETVFIQSALPLEGQVSLVNLLGETISQHTVQMQSEFSISLDQIPNGVYILRYTDGTGKHTVVSHKISIAH